MVPVGTVKVDVMKGFEYHFVQAAAPIKAGDTSKVTVYLKPLNIPRESGSTWVSGDVHVHMNYGGAYRDTPARLVLGQSGLAPWLVLQNLIRQGQLAIFVGWA